MEANFTVREADATGPLGHPEDLNQTIRDPPRRSVQVEC